MVSFPADCLLFLQVPPCPLRLCSPQCSDIPPHPTRHLSLSPASMMTVSMHSGRPATGDKQAFGLPACRSSRLPPSPRGNRAPRPCACAPYLLEPQHATPLQPCKPPVPLILPHLPLGWPPCLPPPGLPPVPSSLLPAPCAQPPSSVQRRPFWFLISRLISKASTESIGTSNNRPSLAAIITIQMCQGCRCHWQCMVLSTTTMRCVLKPMKP